MSRLIDADALKEQFREGAYTVKGIREEIDNAPTVDTTCPNCDSGYAQGYSDGYLKGKEERPQGEWIRQGKGDDCRCSECGCSAMYFSQLDEDEQEVFGTLTTDWCPWCGADMRGKEND